MAKPGEHRRQIEDALAPALRLARRLPPWNTSRILLRIAGLAMRYRQAALARELMAEAFAAHDAYERERGAGTEPDLDFYWSAAHALAATSRSSDAIRAALMLPPPSQHSGGSDTALASIAGTFAWQGDIASLRRILPHLRTPLGRLDTLWRLADAYARRGKPRLAASTIRGMRGSRLAANHKRGAWRSVAEWLAFRGDATAAFAAARAVRGSEDRAALLASLAEWAAASQPLLLPDMAVAIERRRRRVPPQTYLEAALAAARRLTKDARERALVRIALAAAKIGSLDIARDILARRVTASVSQGDEIRFHIAAAEARAGRIEDARKLANRLSGRWRAAALATIAAAAAAAGNESSALAIAAKISSLELRVDALLDIARVASAQGRGAEARRQLRALSQLAMPERRRVPSEVIEAIACEQARIGDARGAARTLLGRRDYPHVPSFAATAVALAKAGHDDAAWLFGTRAASADEQATLLAEILLIRHARKCPRCRKAMGGD